ncbi:hypothetical protein [Terriglobus sp. RCC_193]|uniref:hypothetical protein n=1 Tax=Terriglobus sp. RCC_193 TaxID=3239218 RepID=UPI003524F65A
MRWSRLLIAMLFASAMSPLCAQKAPQPGCTQQKTDYYQCNGDAFQHLLAVSKNVRVDTGRMDSFGRRQMVKLVGDLGKKLVTPEQRPDLVFELTWIDRSGRIDFGPGDVAVARLNIYDPSRGRGEQSLVWVETLTGQQDIPWPSMVTQLRQQFQHHVAGA